ncbi:1-(5-phosphoribosyl)-5-[(5-phosphoribosylamino)methylideneamino]imidazole-4-carboxamide isomerase [Fulvivirga lutea]|uniref:1-(5-phosphoribosyl)-5-[(5-phosphoribosylamino)methylideneamino] imidazole-4-carboxamide isomerase n=1 Tax=Fulvivirga lutea TaxID=2810512 RepID=A0A974WEK4_9BACT|nr:1-(5-phosphoribosyl)-5-[(5-phosphoribosylamino)methylideneamino]imidazole-4-carboxamide isomerase [Fulvivirga lutea]QSE96184.1 1-(5-phosphoribosyl)-5-[(5-phosphoribosylamino)methylideneamino]imidazole-4-carboxamide isomerase [Fulvivirga lutea]
MRIIPAIDIIDGKCVRLKQGDYNAKTIYNSNPVEVAKIFEDNGIKFLHLVDLDGAKSGKIVNYKVLESIAQATSLTIDFGGGVKSDNDIELAFNSGASQVTCGSIAVKQPEKVFEWIENYGSEKLILGADVKNKMVATSGWTETSSVTIDNLLLNFLPKNLRTVICTDISTDGMLQGPNIDLYNELLHNHPSIRLIASGGVSCIEDVQQLKKKGLYGVIIGKAIYENKISLKDLSDYA